MKKLSILLLVVPVLVFAQSQDQNYIKNITYKEPSSQGQIDVSNPAHARVTVQYFDGLGRPIQQVAHKQSNKGKDIIVHTQYDEFGRQTKEYLPYVRSNSSLNFDPSGEANTLSFYANNDTSLTGNLYFETTNNPYSEKLLESSPLSRVYKQAAPGNPWAMNSGKEIKFDYQTNKDGDVAYFKANTVWSSTFELYDIELVRDGDYGANQLYKTITKDENWTLASGKNNTTEEFKNKQGQVVLKRTYANTSTETEVPHDTYYVYDMYGNLTYVIPPKVNVQAVSEDDIKGLCYQYRYDSRNRLVEKKLPGKQWEFIVYNKLDQPVATGPSYTPYGGENIGWLITKYDAFGRVVYTGWKAHEIINSQVRNEFQLQLNASTQPLFENKTTSANSIDGVQVKYTNQAIPTDPFELLTVNYYDNYDYPNGPTPPTDIYGDSVLTNVKTLPTGSWIRFLTKENETDGELSTTFYDVKGRPIATNTINHLGGNTYTQSKLDFEGKVQYTVTEHKRSSSDDIITLRDEFSYSPQSKLLTHVHKVNTNQKELIVSNEYDELGQLISKQVGGTDLETFVGHQKVDYQYNIRGWLRSINNENDLTQSIGNFQDLFAFKINYNAITSFLNGVKSLYNGNISETFWITSSDNTLRQYSYAYDELNRLKNAIYQKPTMNIPVRNSYDETMSYDKNGNIMSLTRTGDYDSALYAQTIDILAYAYDNNSNILRKVTDTTNSTLGFKDDSNGTNDTEDDYDYDDHGNMVSDQNKGITRIKYNHLNLPTHIDFGNGTHIYYFYNAAGVKLTKEVNIGFSNNIITDYLGGFQYENNILQFFPHPEGYVKHTLDKNKNSTYDYVYNYTDHLGNIRLSYALDPATNVLKILEENHYYPFGLKHTNYSTSKKGIVLEPVSEGKMILPVENVNYKYKYNGKEWQDELGLNFYDYGARNYDPAIGRWMNIDPLAENSRRWNPYNYAYNNPVYFIDPDGMQARDFETDLYNTDGKKIGTDGVENGVKMVVTDKKEAREISKIKGNVDLNNVQSGVTLPSDATLQESINVLDRTIANGGLKEESSIVMNDGTVVQGQTGSMPTYANGVQTASATLPNLPAGTTPADAEATIHSYPTTVQQVGNMIYPQSANTPSGADTGTFSQYNRNIIVGPLGTINPNNVTANPNGSLNIPSRQNGAVIYDRNTTPLVELTRKAIVNILRN